MRGFIGAALAVAALAAIPGVSSAGPLIIATSVTPGCKILAGNVESSVTVTLNSGTHGFFGGGLWYHFTPTSGGVAVTHPSPVSNPNPVDVGYVAPGHYNLMITDNPGSGGSTSVNYPVTVPAFATISLGSRKMCKETTAVEAKHIAVPMVMPPPPPPPAHH